jgi:hypothetical protein
MTLNAQRNFSGAQSTMTHNFIHGYRPAFMNVVCIDVNTYIYVDVHGSFRGFINFCLWPSTLNATNVTPLF